jgi:hypothetical protein
VVATVRRSANFPESIHPARQLAKHGGTDSMEKNPYQDLMGKPIVYNGLDNEAGERIKVECLVLASTSGITIKPVDIEDMKRRLVKHWKSDNTAVYIELRFAAPRDFCWCLNLRHMRGWTVEQEDELMERVVAVLRNKEDGAVVEYDEIASVFGFTGGVPPCSFA